MHWPNAGGWMGLHWGWAMGVGWIFMVLFWLLIVLGIVALIRWLAPTSREGREAAPKTPLEILEERYARGEIEREEFEQKRRDLQR